MKKGIIIITNKSNIHLFSMLWFSLVHRLYFHLIPTCIKANIIIIIPEIPILQMKKLSSERLIDFTKVI